LHANLCLRWRLKQSCSPRQKLFNCVSHTTCTQGNRVDFGLLMIGNQIANLTPDLSFGHNLCFKCLNTSCKPILDTYISFQWYKKLFNLLGFNPCNRSPNIRESIRTPTPKVEVPLGVWRFIPSHFLSLPGFLSLPTTLQALILVTSPRLRLRHKHFLIFNLFFFMFWGYVSSLSWSTFWSYAIKS
jgi:hypothetical protein